MLAAAIADELDITKFLVPSRSLVCSVQLDCLLPILLMNVSGIFLVWSVSWMTI